MPKRFQHCQQRVEFQQAKILLVVILGKKATVILSKIFTKTNQVTCFRALTLTQIKILCASAAQTLRLHFPPQQICGTPSEPSPLPAYTTTVITPPTPAALVTAAAEEETLGAWWCPGETARSRQHPCRTVGCRREAGFGSPDDRARVACAAHRAPDHISLKHRLCEIGRQPPAAAADPTATAPKGPSPACWRRAYFGDPAGGGPRYCRAHCRIGQSPDPSAYFGLPAANFPSPPARCRPPIPALFDQYFTRRGPGRGVEALRVARMRPSRGPRWALSPGAALPGGGGGGGRYGPGGRDRDRDRDSLGALDNRPAPLRWLKPSPSPLPLRLTYTSFPLLDPCANVLLCACPGMSRCFRRVSNCRSYRSGLLTSPHSRRRSTAPCSTTPPPPPKGAPPPALIVSSTSSRPGHRRRRRRL